MVDCGPVCAWCTLFTLSSLHESCLEEIAKCLKIHITVLPTSLSEKGESLQTLKIPQLIPWVKQKINFYATWQQAVD